MAVAAVKPAGRPTAHTRQGWPGPFAARRYPAPPPWLQSGHYGARSRASVRRSSLDSNHIRAIRTDSLRQEASLLEM